MKHYSRTTASILTVFGLIALAAAWMVPSPRQAWLKPAGTEEAKRRPEQRIGRFGGNRADGDCLSRHTAARAAVASLPAASDQRPSDSLCQPLSRPTLPLPQLCFSPETPLALIESLSLNQGRFFQERRWTTTAIGGPTGQKGDPITLTYSFPPDGARVPSLFGIWPEAPNDFNAEMNRIYGSPDVWKPIFEQAFARWSLLSGITFVYEPNDDGADVNLSPGVQGVRGDVRIAGRRLDFSYGVLAYNNYPDDGDMVFDTSDFFFDNTLNDSIRLRNVIAHEHGHGMGQNHVCPSEETKLLEPFLTVAFDGPQHDDIRNAHGLYGDSFEPDNEVGLATHIGSALLGAPLVVGPVPPPTVANGSILSIDADGEEDYFKFDVIEPGLVSVTVTPIGANYDDSPQQCDAPRDANCCAGEFTNSLLVADLNVELISTDGRISLGKAERSAIGAEETLANVLLPEAGTYYIRVYEGNEPAETQLYHLSVAVAECPPSANDCNSNNIPDECEAQTQIVYDVRLTGLLNAPGNCGNGSRHNKCTVWIPALRPGISWVDRGFGTPIDVMIEFNIGVQCHAIGTVHTPHLNYKLGEPFVVATRHCTCDLREGEVVTFHADPQDYLMGEKNRVRITGVTKCLGLTPNVAWGPGVYGRATVTYAIDCNANGIPDDCDTCGDLDEDNLVDGVDFDVFLKGFGRGRNDPNYHACADSDADGLITLADYQAWLQCYRDFVGDSESLPPTPAGVGDMDGNDIVDGSDIQPFLDILFDPATADFRESFVANTNGDTSVDSEDVGDFVGLLLTDE